MGYNGTFLSILLLKRPLNIISIFGKWAFFQIWLQMIHPAFSAFDRGTPIHVTSDLYPLFGPIRTCLRDKAPELSVLLFVSESEFSIETVRAERESMYMKDWILTSSVQYFRVFNDNFESDVVAADRIPIELARQVSDAAAALPLLRVLPLMGPRAAA